YQHQHRRRLARGGGVGGQPHSRLTAELSFAATPLPACAAASSRYDRRRPVPVSKGRRLHQKTPAAPAVRDTLERILASDTFARSERARRLLRYLVEQELDGNTDRLKG